MNYTKMLNAYKGITQQVVEVIKEPEPVPIIPTPIVVENAKNGGYKTDATLGGANISVSREIMEVADFLALMNIENHGDNKVLVVKADKEPEPVPIIPTPIVKNAADKEDVNSIMSLLTSIK